jgi:hypothetical protein
MTLFQQEKLYINKARYSAKLVKNVQKKVVVVSFMNTTAFTCKESEKLQTNSNIADI